MGLLDSLGLGDTLKGALGQIEAAGLPALVNSVLAKTQYHDLNGLVAKLQQGGLGPQVQSWLGNQLEDVQDVGVWATAEAQDPVPDDCVSPTPRS